MGPLLGLLGLGGLLFGLISLVRPLGWFGVTTRKQAISVLAISLAVVVVGAAFTPSPDNPEEPVAAETTTSTSTRSTTTSMSTSPASSSTQVPPSTTTIPTTSSPQPADTLVLDLLAAIPVALETPAGYDRDLFEVWSDEDGDGCDTREEVLLRDAVESPSVGSGCDVGTGLWFSVYDGVWLDHAQQLQVDHVVALKEAWDSGAREWDRSRRVAFGNDLTSSLTLIAVSSASNQDKGDADPSNWLPPNEGDVCRYIAAWVVIKATWELSMDPSEHGRITNLFESQCEGTTVGGAVVAYPTPPATTTTTPAPTSTVAGSVEVVIANIRYDGPGNDVEFGDSEYVLLRNDGTGTADVGRWWLEDEAGHVITIPDGYLIQPEAELRIYSGPGDDTATAYYEGLGQAIWNNSGGDTATLRNAAGTTVDSYSYSS
ncbi:MAG: lamin tail domain-containing protein [Acidimicrobiia bacterium]|nr:lamin tail domain-containing protein [Acidimicrobiia bacterium]